MEPFTTLTARVVALPIDNIDTDQIIPARFLKTTDKNGLGKSLFADWREAGCSMCIAMNGDQLDPGQYAISTSNRNFEGRQGRGGRTLLASPLTAAASAIAGVVTDPRTLPGIEQPATVGGGY